MNDIPLKIYCVCKHLQTFVVIDKHFAAQMLDTYPPFNKKELINKKQCYFIYYMRSLLLIKTSMATYHCLCISSDNKIASYFMKDHGWLYYRDYYCRMDGRAGTGWVFVLGREKRSKTSVRTLRKKNLIKRNYSTLVRRRVALNQKRNRVNFVCLTSLFSEGRG